MRLLADHRGVLERQRDVANDPLDGRQRDDDNDHDDGDEQAERARSARGLIPSEPREDAASRSRSSSTRPVVDDDVGRTARLLRLGELAALALARAPPGRARDARGAQLIVGDDGDRRGVAPSPPASKSSGVSTTAARGGGAAGRLRPGRRVALGDERPQQAPRASRGRPAVAKARRASAARSTRPPAKTPSPKRPRTAPRTASVS